MSVKYLPLPKGFKISPDHAPLYTEKQMKAYVKAHMRLLEQSKGVV